MGFILSWQSVMLAICRPQSAAEDLFESFILCESRVEIIALLKVKSCESCS